MKKLKYLFFNLILLSTTTVFSGCTLADFWGGKASETLTLDDIPVVLNNVINWLLGGAASVAVIFIIIGGYLYITSHGSQEQTQKAKTTIFWAIGGLILIIAAYAIVRLLMSFLIEENYFQQIMG